jgi:hypothetical protein
VQGDLCANQTACTHTHTHTHSLCTDTKAIPGPDHPKVVNTRSTVLEAYLEGANALLAIHRRDLTMNQRGSFEEAPLCTHVCT